VGLWRLRWTRQLWVLNAVLVFPYYFSGEITSCRWWRAQHGDDRTPDLFCEQEWFGPARNLTYWARVASAAQRYLKRACDCFTGLRMDTRLRPRPNGYLSWADRLPVEKAVSTRLRAAAKELKPEVNEAGGRE
jgi:hypothetical protein